jgi:hypothetical protein
MTVKNGQQRVKQQPIDHDNNNDAALWQQQRR